MDGSETIIVVSGADGSGKSTLVAALAKTWPAARVVTIWDLGEDPAAKPIFASREQLQRFLGCLLPESRSLFLMSCLKAAMDRAAPGPLLIDAYWYKYLANELALGAEPDRILPLARLFAAPTLTLHIDLDPAVAAQRKEGRYSPYECGLRSPTLENFMEFQTRTRPIVQRLMEGHSPTVVTLDGTAAPGALAAQALAHLRAVAA